MKLSTWIFLVVAAALCLLECVPGFRLLLDPWLSRRQKRNLRELPTRLPLDATAFISRMSVATGDATVVAAVRQQVAEGVAYLLGSQVSGQLVYPQDRIVMDLGIGSGPDDSDTAIVVALEKDLGITIPDHEAKVAYTVEDLVHLCARRRGPGTCSCERGQ